MTKTLPLALALACAALLPAAPALASHNQESLIEDEHQLLELSPAVQARALDDVKALGADVIRANIVWRRYAPSPNSRRRPKRFTGRDPAAYPPGVFNALDGLVAGAQQRGITLLLTPTGPGPSWASRCHRRRGVNLHTCKPDPRLFGNFVRALGTRYPSVTHWSIYNEPNQPGWLSPQYDRRGPIAADLYRALARSGLAALRASGHRGQDLLIGETSPIGRTSGSLANRPVTPEAFIRELFCLTPRARGCRGFRRFAVTGYAHHPYTRGGSRPPLSRTLPGEITIGNGHKLDRLLDQAARRGRIPRRLPVLYTENGWQTNPPDLIFGVTPAQQAAYIDQSDWIAYRDPRVRMVAQYKLVDDAEQSSFQSGLRFTDGRAKPSYDAYRLPIWVVKHGSRVTVYGQVRPAPDGAAGQVEVQSAAGSGAAFQTVQVVDDTSPKGQFTVKLPASGTVWRLRWNGITSREAEAAPR